MARLRFLTLLAGLSLAVAAWAPSGSAYASGGQKTAILVTIRSYLPLSQTRIRARQVGPLTWDVFRTDQALAPKGARQTQSYRLPSDTAERLEVLLKDPQTYSETHSRDPDDSCTDADTIIIEIKQDGVSRRFGFSCQNMGRLGEVQELVAWSGPDALGVTRSLPSDALSKRATNKVHRFSEGYLGGGTGVDIIAIRNGFGRWTVMRWQGAPGHWSAPTRYVLSRASSSALEELLNRPSSYLDEPAPEGVGDCLDPWSTRIEWSWRSRTGALYQQCGPWGVTDQISRLLR